jgi:hypothetical protein
MITYWIKSEQIESSVFIPKFYDPEIPEYLEKLKDQYEIFLIEDLVQQNVIEVSTGHEIGKLAYGTGDIPFVRTSDISNWEIKTAPKQGVSQDIYEEYKKSQDVQEGDILLVKDGTYLIGTNCFITALDTKILFQSHILKFRIKDKQRLNPLLFFLALNSDIVQKQIRSIQFTADIIDTIGQRYLKLSIPVPKSSQVKECLIAQAEKSLKERVIGKAFIKQCPFIIENILKYNSLEPLENFHMNSIDDLKESLVQDTVRAEFGEFEAFWLNSDEILQNIYLPKYYDPLIEDELKTLSKNCEIISLGELKKKGVLNYYTGDEIGKMAYGTGDIPFIRTTDFANWEIKHDPKQGVSEEIYEEYHEKENVKENDIFLVRDGTYLVGTSAIVTKYDEKCLFCGGIYKISTLKPDYISPWLLLGLLNSYIVKRQIRTKQFTRDVIDTLGNRLDEVFLPIPTDTSIKNGLEESIKKTILSRIGCRNNLKQLVTIYASFEESIENAMESKQLLLH